MYLTQRGLREAISKYLPVQYKNHTKAVMGIDWK